ncbi:MAG: hypothetical protein Q9182_004555 [Xanthomendoza sp. 2 TL-2023]
MGNDGGSIPTRRELVKEAAKDPNTTQVKETQIEKLHYYWSHCAWSQKPLIPPIVSDSTGNLYNKDAVLEFLLETNQNEHGSDIASNERTAGTIQSLKDVVEVHFKIEDNEEDHSKAQSKEVRMLCPVTGKRLGPGVKAVYLVPCGHAFAETAVREMPMGQCLECNEAYSPNNVLPILPVSAAEKDRLRDRLSKLQSEDLTHSLKRAARSGKKRKKTQLTKEAEPAGATAESTGPELGPKGTTADLSSAGIKNQGTASLTAKALAEQDNHYKRRKMEANENLKSLFSSSDGMAGKRSDFMTRGFSIPAGAKR